MKNDLCVFEKVCEFYIVSLQSFHGNNRNEMGLERALRKCHGVAFLARSDDECSAGGDGIRRYEQYLQNPRSPN